MLKARNHGHQSSITHIHDVVDDEGSMFSTCLTFPSAVFRTIFMNNNFDKHGLSFMGEG